MFSKATRFEIMLEAVPDALVGMDQKGMIRFVNRQTELLFGYSREDLIDNPIDTLVPETLWQIYASHRDEYFADPRTRSSGLDLELSGRHRDGSDFPVNVSMSHIDTGDVLLVITAVREVAKQKRAVKSAELQAAIVEYSEDAIIGSTLEGIVTSWNPAAERLYGYSSREMIGKSASVLNPEDRPGDLAANLATVKDGHALDHFETIRVRKDGSPVQVSLTIAPIHDEEGSIIGASSVHRDVTEQRRAFETAQRLASVVENSGDAIASRTLDGIITSWNPAAEKMFGYTGEEVIGKFVDIMVPASLEGDRRQAVTAEVAAGRTVRFEVEVVRKDGTVIPVAVTASPIVDADGTAVGVSVISRDITEQRQAHEVAQRLASIVESSDDAIIGRTLDDRITSWNPAAEKMYGYSGQEVIGKSIDLLIPEDRHSEIEAVLSKIKGGQHQRLDTIRVRRDGTAFPASITVSPIRDVDGAIIGISAIHRDVTEQKRAFELARRMEAIVENSDDAIVGGASDGAITSWNAAAERMYGYSREEVIGKSVIHLVPEDRRDELEGALAAIRAGEHVNRLETTRHRKDGTTFFASITISPLLDADGRVIGASAITRDVTEQRQAFEVAQRMASVVENSDDAIVAITLEGIITSWNRGAERMYGYSGQEIIGQSISLLVPPERHDEMTRIPALIRAGQDVVHLQTVRVRKDGAKIPIALTISPVHSPDGQLSGTSGVGRDLSEHEQAAHYARSLIEADLDPLVAISIEGKISDVNEAGARITGHPRETLIGSDYAQYVTEPDTARQYFELTFEQGWATDFPLTVRHRNGTLTEILCNAAVYRDIKGDVLGVVASGREMAGHHVADAGPPPALD
jgi:PAS domain S-box-containing protein